MSNFTIGEVVSRTGLAASAIRYYETAGVVPKPDRVNGRRIYDESWMKWLGIVMLAQEAGFSLNEIRELVKQFPKNTAPSKRWKNAATKKIEELDYQLAHIKKMQSLLRICATCKCSVFEECGEAASQYLNSKRN